MVVFYSYVSLPEGNTHCNWISTILLSYAVNMDLFHRQVFHCWMTHTHTRTMSLELARTFHTIPGMLVIYLQSWYPLVNKQFANLNTAIEIVDLPIDSTMDLSIVFCRFTRPGNPEINPWNIQFSDRRYPISIIRTHTYIGPTVFIISHYIPLISFKPAKHHVLSYTALRKFSCSIYT